MTERRTTPRAVPCPKCNQPPMKGCKSANTGEVLYYFHDERLARAERVTKLREKLKDAKRKQLLNS